MVKCKGLCYLSQEEKESGMPKNQQVLLNVSNTVVCVIVALACTLSNQTISFSFLAMGKISPLLRYVAQRHQSRKYTLSQKQGT